MLWCLLGAMSGMQKAEDRRIQKQILTEVKNINTNLTKTNILESSKKNSNFSERKSPKQVHVISINGVPVDEYHYL